MLFTLQTDGERMSVRLKSVNWEWLQIENGGRRRRRRKAEQVAGAAAPLTFCRLLTGLLDAAVWRRQRSQRSGRFDSCYYRRQHWGISEFSGEIWTYLWIWKTGCIRWLLWFTWLSAVSPSFTEQQNWQTKDLLTYLILAWITLPRKHIATPQTSAFCYHTKTTRRYSNYDF